MTFRFGEPESGLLYLAALAQCNKTMGAVEIKVCLYEQHEGIYNLVQNGCAPAPDYKTDNAYIQQITECDDGTSYMGWIWGWASSGRYVYNSHGGYTQSFECSTNIDGQAEAWAEFALEQIAERY